MWPKWPRILLLLVVAAPLGTLSENRGDTTPSDEEAFGGSTSPSTTPSPKPEDTTDRLINGDLRKAARVEPMSGPGQKRGEEEQYDVVDVMAATGAGTGSGRPKSGQTTRIYTTGEVDESFWLKHLGDDFKHAIHLQVGGTNEEYNRLLNQTQNGVHEEVHHEYLPGAERPDEGGYARRNQQQQQQQQSFDRRSLAMKQKYLIHQQAQQQMERYNYAQQHSQHYTPQSQQHTQQYPQYPQHPQHPQQHTQHHQQQQHQYPETPLYRPNTYQKPQNQGYIINSSEDQLHASQSSPAPVRSGLGGAGGAGGQEEVEGDSFDSQLNFKSPFNDYGSRPTRDLTYLLYRRGL